MCEDEDFIRYHFGEMTPAQREEFQQRLEQDEDLVERYARFLLCVEQHESESTPCGLAERTSNTLRSIGWTSGLDFSSASARCRAVDWTIGSAAVLLVALALIPATLQSREAARRAVCTENLRLIGVALHEYSNDHGGFYPSIGPRNYAGLYAVRLAEDGHIAREILVKRLVCPSSMLAKQIEAGRAKIVVPTLAELRVAPAPLMSQLRYVMGGSYAYRFGYVDNGDYRPVKDDRNCRTALLGDAPPDAASSRRNHGCSQNILFQDGSVRLVSGCWSDNRDDHLFLNAFGKIAAGATRGDTVLAPSWARPDSGESNHWVGPTR